MESNGRAAVRAAARAFAGARAATIIGPRALSITKRRARGTSLCFPTNPTTNLLVLPFFTQECYLANVF